MANYDVSILQGGNKVNPSNPGADSSDSDEPGGNPSDHEIEGDQSPPDAKATTTKAKVAVKKEIIPSKRVRSQVDRIADTEIVRLECKKTKFTYEQQRLKTIASVASVKAQERSHRLVEIREAELNFERQKLQLDHEYRLEILKHGQVFPPSSQLDSYGRQSTSYGSQPHPVSWPGKPYNTPQPSVIFKAPSLEDFPLPPSENSGGDHGGSSGSMSGLFDGVIY